MKSIAVLGSGAMGGLFGGLLQEAGYRVCLIDVDAPHIDAVKAQGLRLTTDAGDRRIAVPIGRAADFRGPVDVLLVFTKAYHTVEALASVGHLIGADTWAVTLQNGLDTGERLEAAVPRNRIAIGMTNWPGEFTAPGHVSSHGVGRVRMWSLSGEPDAALNGVEEALNGAGLRCTLDPNVTVAIWEKVAFNAAMNSISAVCRLPVGPMGDSPDIRAIAASVVREAAATAHALGIPVDERRIWAAVEQDYVEHREHRPSMLQDVLAGKRTEIDSINGAIVAHAARAGISVPVIETLAHLVRAIGSARP